MGMVSAVVERFEMEAQVVGFGIVESMSIDEDVLARGAERLGEAWRKLSIECRGLL